MNVLVCVKRIPGSSGKVTLTDDEQQVETKHVGFTISPHEECAVEAAVQLVESAGGSGAATILTLGPADAEAQLREALALGATDAVLLETDDDSWDPVAVARAISALIDTHRAAGKTYDLVLFGNEAGDTADFQVGVRVAHLQSLPCVAGVKSLTVSGDGPEAVAEAGREASGGTEMVEVALPAVLTIKEGLNVPRYPSVPGRIKAKRAPLERVAPEHKPGGVRRLRLSLPAEQPRKVTVLGNGPDAAPAVVAMLREIGVLES
jgi:electron transfer flavoprotein beta subunit